MILNILALIVQFEDELKLRGVLLLISIHYLINHKSLEPD